MTPLEASKNENKKKVYTNLYSDIIYLKPGKVKFQIGDKVRVSKCEKKVFDRGYTPNWTEEISVVNEVLNTKPVTYKIVDLKGEEVKESFYEKSYKEQNKKHLELKKY